MRRRLPLRETLRCHHPISWQMTQPTATEKCKQACEKQIRFYLDDLHMEILVSLSRLVGTCACFFLHGVICLYVCVVCVVERVRATPAGDFISLPLALPGGQQYLEYDSYLKHSIVQLQPLH